MAKRPDAGQTQGMNTMTPAPPSLSSLSLDGMWDLRWHDGFRGGSPKMFERGGDPKRAIPAQVPGEVHLDLLRAGLIADPYTGTGVLACRWVEECRWTYRRQFSTSESALEERAWLIFEGLDLDAVIILNGIEIGQHHNSFRPCRIEVTGKLKANDNLLVVHIDAGLFGVADKPAAGYVGTIDGLLHKRWWLRKPQSQAAWDWSPRLLNVGIHGPVRLEWTAAAMRLEMLVPLVTVSEDLASGTVLARAIIEGLRSEAVPATLLLTVDGAAPVQVEITVKPGLHTYELSATVPSPALWWPVGHGQQPRSMVTLTLSNAGAAQTKTVVASRSTKVGFRHVRVDQTPHSDGGQFFVLTINHRRIFAKGGNMVPADLITAAIDGDRYATLIDRALEANFNLLRVWGGGLYEHDDFYEQCDARGILVWQEFIFACSRYPGTDPTFYHEIEREAVHQVRRLAAHPSLVVWCGNNEISWGDHEWGYDQGATIPHHALFHHLLPKVMLKEDPTRFYQSSSPWSPIGEHPNADHIGDQHPWSIGFNNTDFRGYRTMTCRFPNEGGVVGPNALPTVLSCLPEGQRHFGSFAWQVHDNSIISSEEPAFHDRMVIDFLGADKDPRQLTVEQWVYWAGLLQGEALGEYIHAFRRRMFSSASAIFWMFNDCWPTVRSWTIVDHALRRTPSFQPVRRAFAAVSVVVATVGDAVQVIGVNDTAAAVTAELRSGLFTIAGAYPLDQRATVTLAANAATVLAEFPRSAWTDEKTQIAFAVLTDGGVLIARHRLILPRFCELTWNPAMVTVRHDSGRAVFSSATFAWGVCIDLDGERPLADNFFDVYPCQDYSLAWPDAEPPCIIAVGNLS